MNRAFLSLYFVVVVSVLLVGWGADRLWQVYSPEPSVGPFELAFFEVLQAELNGRSAAQARMVAAQLSQLSSLNITLFSLEELASTSISERISQGDIVIVHDADGNSSSYKRMANGNTVARITVAPQAEEKAGIYFAILTAFYVTIALMIYVWIWPLARDLKKLQQQTQKVGVGGAVEIVDLAPSSTLYQLASAFNRMTRRIHELLSSHKEMTYAVSHELRTPLARMKFALAMAEESMEKPRVDPEAIKKQIASVVEDVAEMDKLINELLAYASFEQQESSLVFKQGDLPALVQSVVASHCSMRTSPVIDVHISSQLSSGKVSCEWYLFERCIHNLVQNAFKYAVSRINILLVQEGDQCVITIEDDGPGVRLEDAEKIFQAFVRLRHGRSDNKSGFGLGLAIVHRIMKWHCGSIEVHRSELGGAKFVLRWPGYC